MHKTGWLFNCALSLVVIASPCFADPFCDGIHKVVAVAPEFTALDSEKNGTYVIPGAKPLTFPDGGSLPACTPTLFPDDPPGGNFQGGVLEWHKSHPGFPEYQCRFPSEGGAAAASAAMTARVAACLMTQIPQPTESDADYDAYFIVQSGMKYRIFARDDSDGTHELVLDIMQDFAPSN